MRRPTYKLFAILTTAMLASFCNTNLAHAQTLQIDSMTADWLEGFADFMRWDNREKPDQIVIGVLGSNEVANYLQQRAKERKSKTSILVVNLSADDSFDTIHILFVGPGTRQNWEKINEKCCAGEILSIGAQDGFIRNGGCVEFVVRKNQLRFYIDTRNAQNCGIEISSKLLELAIEPRK